MERLTGFSNGKYGVLGCGKNCRYEYEYCIDFNYTLCPTISGIIDKLAEYENAEEQGLLMKPPCKVGDTVYWVSNWYGFGGNYKVYPEKADKFIYDGLNMVIDMSGGKEGVYGKTVFLTQAEAEETLRKLKGENKEC